MRRVTLIILTIVCGETQGAVREWTGGGGTGRWSTAANWVPAVVPVNGDEVVVKDEVAGSGPFTTDNDLSGLEVAGITVGGGVTVTGREITLTGKLTRLAGGVEAVLPAIRLGGTGGREMMVRGNLRLGGMVMNGRDVVVDLEDAKLTVERPEGTGTVSLRSEDESGEVVVRTPPVAGAAAGLLWVVDGCEVTVDSPAAVAEPVCGGEFVVGGSGRESVLMLEGGRALREDAVVKVFSDGWVRTFGITGPGFVTSELPLVELHGGRLVLDASAVSVGGIRGMAGTDSLITNNARGFEMNFAEGRGIHAEAGARVTVDVSIESGRPARFTGKGTVAIAPINDGSPGQPGGELGVDEVVVDGPVLVLDDTEKVARRAGGVMPPRFTVRGGGVLVTGHNDLGTQTVVPDIVLEGGTLRIEEGVVLEAGAGLGISVSGTSRMEVVGNVVLRSRISGTGTLVFDAATAEARETSSLRLAASAVAAAHDGNFFEGATDIRLRTMRWVQETRPAAGTELLLGVPGAAVTIELSDALDRMSGVTVRPGTTVRQRAALPMGLLRFTGSGRWNASAGEVIEADRVRVQGIGSQVTLTGELESGEELGTGAAGNVLVHAGALRGTGTVVKTGAGLLRLSGSSAGTFSGALAVEEGEVNIEKPTGVPVFGGGDLRIGERAVAVVRVLGHGNLDGGTAVLLGTGGELDMSAVAAPRLDVIGTLTGAGVVRLPSGGLAIGVDDGSGTYGGAVTGGGLLVKAGAGVQRLGGSVSPAGNVVVAGGTLILNGAVTAGAVTVRPGAVLGGIGVVPAVTVESGGGIAPGDGGGELSTGNLQMLAGSRFLNAIVGSGAAAVFGRVKVTGTVAVDGAVLEFGQSTLPVAGAEFRLIDNNGSDAISGLFAGVVNGGVWSVGNLDFTAMYGGGTGNDFVLKFAGTNTVPSGQPPVFPNPALVRVDEGGVAEVLCVASDPDPAQTMTYALVAPVLAGAVLDARTGLLRVTTNEMQGGTVLRVSVRATDNGSPPQSVVAEAVIEVREANAAPFADYFVEGGVDEGETVRIEPQSGTGDSDLPRQVLRYELVAPVPGGMVIDAVSGVISFTPVETQGGTTVVATVRVTDDGVPALSGTGSVAIAVSETNRRPVIEPVASEHTVNEGEVFTLAIRATDADVPAQVLSYRVGFVVEENPAITNLPTVDGAGVFRWVTSEADLPGPYAFSCRVSDSAGQVATVYFRVNVVKRNKAPTVGRIEDVVLRPGEPMRLRIRGRDVDLPEQVLEYTLAGGAPAGMVIGRLSGELEWTPGVAQVAAVFPVTVRVADNGVPAKVTEVSFRVWVRVGARPALPVVGVEPRPTAGGYRLRFTLPAGSMYEVQSAVDPGGVWTSRGVFTSAGGEQVFIDNPANAPVRRFYRLVIP